MKLAELINRQLPHTTDLRHRLHRIPELGFEEHKTAQTVRAELDRLNIPYVAGVPSAQTATIAWIGDTRKPCIALRAEIDALPIEERTGCEYCSTHPGCMHACGHDGHSAMLFGTLAILDAMKSELNVCVKFIWQPAEEGGGGAKRLVEAGVLDGRIGPEVAAIFGLHGWPALKVGTIATKPGALLAATDNFHATFRGKGTHGAYPHQGADPIVAAAEAVTSVQKFVSRETDPTEACVVTVGKLNAGTAVNVIPDVAKIEATVRTLTDAQRAHAKRSLERRMRGIAQANNCELDWTWLEGYPSVVNDPEMADYVAKVARSAFGDNHFIPVAKPSMGGEDFAYYLQNVPGCFFLMGVEPEDCTTKYPTLHSDRYDFTDAALAVGMRMFIELVTRWGR